MGKASLSMGSLIFCSILLLFLSSNVFGESCQKVKLIVPSKLYSGALIGNVNLKHCVNSDNLLARSNNEDFVVLDDGSVYAGKTLSMSSSKKSFAIVLMDLHTMNEHKIPVKLVTKKKIGKTRHTRDLVLKRIKRRWRPLPFSILENYIGPFPCFVQQIQSDTQENYTITYSLTGEGVDQPPMNLFYIDPPSGNIFVTQRVDRETYSSFSLMANAFTKDGYSPELPLPVEIKVEDDNDNAPQFTEETFCVEVYEHTKAGVIIGRVNATDRDEPNSLHTKLRYTLISQFPTSPVMFSIHPDYGIITTISDRLDREVLDTYLLLLEVRDMGGQPYGLSSTGTVSITVLDKNDHQPFFLASSYQTEVNENESGMVILRIPIKDNDMVNTPNWRVVYSILKGNERGWFNITTDPNTNEGLLSVIKGLNYEETPRIQLEVGAANEANLISVSGTKSVGMSTVPVLVIVRNVDEGPEFQPLIKIIRTRENQTIGTVIGQYQAIDPETKNSNGIRYSKLEDKFMWVNIDANTGQITTAKVLDYESNEAPTHQYNVTILATDSSGKTGTGTLVINLDDVNDNSPEISRKEYNICQMGRKYAEIVATDADASPNSSPLKFSLDTSSDASIGRNWKLDQIDGTTMRLQEINDLPLGTHNVYINVVDQQGQGRTQIVTINKCSCPDSLNCGSLQRTSSNVALGGLAILLMVISALLLAAFLCFLLSCLCGAGAKTPAFPDDSAQQNLIVTNTEAPGADVMDQNFKIPVHIANPNVAGTANSNSSVKGIGGRGQNESGQQIIQSRAGHLTESGQNQFETMRGLQTMDSRKHYSEWQSFMNTHIGDKLYMCGQDEEHQHGEDYILPYNYEGKGSLAGSVGCCSEFKGEEERMDYLNHLEPKFRTLAEVCAKK
ncbi:desmocollin-1 [Bombina bombina]|uniref:desmocollin-1 n=1 Tax=Bombina bombina TaxID=8345 RepID=UPI00235AC641|nr:desmocollin-1 [Bombina bombina]